MLRIKTDRAKVTLDTLNMLWVMVNYVHIVRVAFRADFNDAHSRSAGSVTTHPSGVYLPIDKLSFF